MKKTYSKPMTRTGCLPLGFQPQLFGIQEHLKNWLKDAPPAIQHNDVRHPIHDPLYRLDSVEESSPQDNRVMREPAPCDPPNLSRAIPQSLQPGSESMRILDRTVVPKWIVHVFFGAMHGYCVVALYTSKTRWIIIVYVFFR